MVPSVWTCKIKLDGIEEETICVQNDYLGNKIDARGIIQLLLQFIT